MDCHVPQCASQHCRQLRVWAIKVTVDIWDRCDEHFLGALSPPRAAVSYGANDIQLFRTLGPEQGN